MLAIFKDNRGYRIIVEPMNGQDEQTLIKKAKQIAQKRGIISDISITDNEKA